MVHVSLLKRKKNTHLSKKNHPLFQYTERPENSPVRAHIAIIIHRDTAYPKNFNYVRISHRKREA